MTTKQLEDLVNGIKKPNLSENEVKSLLNKEDTNIKPMLKSQPVAQVKTEVVAQHRRQFLVPRVKDSEELLIDKDVNRLKDKIFQIDGVEERKKFIREIGWGIIGEHRGKKYYLYGAKKIRGRKYKLYIGNATS
jgi:hypothetical protein